MCERILSAPAFYLPPCLATLYHWDPATSPVLSAPLQHQWPAVAERFMTIFVYLEGISAWAGQGLTSFWVPPWSGYQARTAYGRCSKESKCRNESTRVEKEEDDIYWLLGRWSLQETSQGRTKEKLCWQLVDIPRSALLISAQFMNLRNP